MKDVQKISAEDFASREKVNKLFNQNLLAYPEAMDYVLKRGISRAVVEAGEVGFCAPYSNYEFALLRGRITVPIRDVHGNIMAFAGRQFELMQARTERMFWENYEPKAAQDKIDKWRKGKWLNESFPKRFHLYHLHVAKAWMRARGWVAGVEGYFDALTLASRNMANVGALCGARLTDWHAALISRYCRNYVSVMDGDEAGENAIEHIRPTCIAAGVQPYVLYMPPGYDPDQFVLEFKAKTLIKIIEDMIATDTFTRRLKI